MHTGSEVSKRESRGGLAFDLVLGQVNPESPKHAPPVLTPSKQTIRSADAIAEKLRAAEERRQSLESQKLSSIKDKDAQIEQLSRRKNEFEERFRESARESYGKKMEAYKENRENYIKSIQDKNREHVLTVEQKRRHSVEDMSKLSEQIAKKLETATEARAGIIQSLRNRLQEHEKHVTDVRAQIESQTESLKEKLNDKLTKATEKRDQILHELQAKLHEHDQHVEEVRQNAIQVKEASAAAASN